MLYVAEIREYSGKSINYTTRETSCKCTIKDTENKSFNKVCEAQNLESSIFGVVDKEVKVVTPFDILLLTIIDRVEQLEYDENKWYDVKLRTISWYAFDEYSFYYHYSSGYYFHNRSNFRSLGEILLDDSKIKIDLSGSYFTLKDCKNNIYRYYLVPDANRLVTKYITLRSK